MLPTPDMNMGARGEMKEWKPRRPSGHHASLTLNDAVRMIDTPSASMYKGSGSNKTVRNRTDYAIEKTRDGTKTGLKLQPAFVEWMMGFPEGWTEIPDSKLLEMRLSRKLQKKS